MVQRAPRLTAAQVILLAGDDLMATGKSEFSEWDLTVAAWSRDPSRFGLRGYEQKHPDHKRVMMEIMGQKPQNPVFQRLMEKVRPNVYRLTPLGRAEAARLRSGGSAAPGAPSAQERLYRTAAALLTHPAYQWWKNDPDQPRRWPDAAAFLAAAGLPATDSAGRLDAGGQALRAAIDWCMAHDVVYLTPAGRAAGEPIHISDLSGGLDFLRVLQYRFPEHLDASGRRAVRV